MTVLISAVVGMAGRGSGIAAIGSAVYGVREMARYGKTSSGARKL